MGKRKLTRSKNPKSGVRLETNKKVMELLFRDYRSR